ncbi:MAG: TIGR00701 family protein [Deltaproteobacteria bacterium RIFCSPLOWO2_02_FULL_46_8]|nr:MAG: TIGR00701 family protein [Deltaproteobacteria bacterium RIFCSPLOWO2_02_FULL_46_8]
MLWWKAFHIIAVIVWMAGLLYLFRLYVYHNQETEPVVRERFQIMELKLLRIITNPATAVTLVTGVAMIWLNPDFLKQGWFHWKLLLVGCLFGIHGSAVRMRKTLAKTNHPYKSVFLKCLSEVPVLLMVAIVLLAVLKP